jgi:esterase
METVELDFEEFGSPDLAPLIILHGFFASARNWRQIAERLSGHFHVYALNLRNHGSSPHVALMDYPSMAADLKRFVDSEGLTSVSLLGHSMGGKVAMWFALNHPGYINKLMVADIAPVSYTHCFNATIKALITLPLNEISNRKQAEMRLADAIPELSYRQFLLQNLVLKKEGYGWRIDLAIFYRMAPNIVAFPNADQLAPFLGKTLFIAGANSGYIKPESIPPLFPEAKLSTIANAGHWLHAQQPDAFLKVVENFCTSG